MAPRAKNWLKNLWINGFKPNATHYSDLFDSFYNVNDDEKVFEYNSADLTDNARILDHDLNTLTPDITIYADGIRAVELNTRVEIFNNTKGLNNSVKITHYDGATNYVVKIKK